MIHQRQLVMILALVSALAISAPALAGDSIQVLKSVSFSENANPRQAVRDECEMQTKLPAFFARCAKALGKDFANWLANPSMNARLGEA